MSRPCSPATRLLLQADILEGARRAGQAGSNFIANVNGVLTCNEVNNDFAEFKEAFCCDVMTAMYWSIGAWYVLWWQRRPVPPRV